MSTLNIGGVVSDNLGGLLTWAIGVTANDFSKLWILVLVCNICNLIPIPLLFFLVPKEEEFERIHEQQRLEDAARKKAEAEALMKPEASPPSVVIDPNQAPIAPPENPSNDTPPISPPENEPQPEDTNRKS